MPSLTAPLQECTLLTPSMRHLHMFSQRVWECSSFCGRPCIIKESCSRPYRHDHFKRKQPAGSRLKQVRLCQDGGKYSA
jgi:hypothetical protein